MQLTRREAFGSLAAVPLLGAAAKAPLPYSFPAVAERREDAEVVIRAYRSVHPGLLRYNTPASLAAAETRLLRDAVTAETPTAWWLACTRFTANLRCGHSFVSPYNQGKAMTAAVTDAVRRLPVNFRWIAGRMIVTRVHGDIPRLTPGCEILAIDGELSAALRRRLLPLTRADGHNDAKRLDLLGSWGRSAHEDFDVLRHVSATAWRDTVRLNWRGRDDRAHNAELPQLSGPSPVATDTPDAALFSSTSVGRGVVLTMPSWVAYKTKWDWRGFIDTTVDAAIATKSPAIIVDLRGNEGGSDCGDVLLARFIDTPLPAPDAARRVHYRTTPPDLDAVLDTWDDSFRKIGVGSPGPDAAGFYDLGPAEDDGGGAIQPKGPRYTGKLIILIDAACSSATFQFAARVRRHRLGTLVGEPTGGNLRGINGGAFFFVRQPHSRLESDLPIIGYYPSGAQSDAGVVPDVLASPTAASIANGTDPGMAAAMRLV